jgi:hypothetical protein
VADHVRHLIDWAERSADDLRRRALDEASTDREAVRRNAGLALARIDLTETKVTQLLEDLREDVQRIAEAADAASPQSPQGDVDAGTRTPDLPPGVREDARPAGEHESAVEQAAVAGEHAPPIEPAVAAPSDSRATGEPAPARDDVTPTGEPAATPTGEPAAAGDAWPSAAAAGDDVPATGQPAAGGEDARPSTAEPAAAGDDTRPTAEPAAAGDDARPTAEPAAARDDWPSVQQAVGTAEEDAPHPSEERSGTPSKRQGGGWFGRRRPTA